MPATFPPPSPDKVIFGTGADGTVSITSGMTQITRDFHYANLTISGTGHLVPIQGHKIKVSGTCDLTAAPAGAIFVNPNNGSMIYNPTAAAASGATGGTQSGVFLSRSSAPTNLIGISGKTGGTGVGTAGAQGNASQQFMYGGRGGAAGAGGASGTPNAGGALAAVVSAAAFGTNLSILEIDPVVLHLVTGSSFTVSAGGGGAVGGAGGGDGTRACGGSGASGNGGGPLRIFANVLNRGGSTAVSAIAARGESAGASANGVAGGTAGGGGGSGGGGGGWIHLVVGTLIGSTGTNILDVSGGDGAAGGNSSSSGKGGNGGDGGNAGVIDVINLSAGTYTHPITGDAAGSAGNTTVTTTGGTGGAGAVGTANL